MSIFLGPIIRAVGAGKQMRRLEDRAAAINPVRPEYEIPEEVGRATEIAQGMATADMPGFGRMLSEAEGAGTRFVSQGRNVASSGADMLQAASQADVNTRRNIGDINVQNQKFRTMGMSNFMRALMDQADYRDTAFDVNQMQPYLQQEGDKRMFEQAAMQQRMNRNEAWASVADGVSYAALMIAGAPVGVSGQSTFARLFGGNTQSSTPRVAQQAITPPTRNLPVMGLNMPNVDIYR